MSGIIITSGDMSATVLEYGATLQRLILHGFDLVVGYETEAEYADGGCYYGATVGRVCNRTPNGRINVNGRSYDIDMNEPQCSLHGGSVGFSHRVWTVEEQTACSVTLSLISVDGDMGYPSDVKAYAEYSLSGGNTLTVTYRAYPTGSTPVCLTNHAYFNLSSGEDVLDTEVKIESQRFSAVNADMQVVGSFDVSGTPFDFNSFHRIGERIGCEHPQLRAAGGYDHNCFLSGKAYAKGDKAEMEMSTTMPCIQFYSGNFCTEGEKLKYGKKGKKHCGFCFEPQFEPGFAARGEHIFTPQTPFISQTVYKFKDRR